MFVTYLNTRSRELPRDDLIGISYFQFAAKLSPSPLFGLCHILCLWLSVVKSAQHRAGSPHCVVPEAIVTGLDPLHNSPFCSISVLRIRPETVMTMLSNNLND